jgi:hypothetical protein
MTSTQPQGEPGPDETAAVDGPVDHTAPADEAGDTTPADETGTDVAGTDDTGRSGPSTNRIILWVIVAGIGLYLVGTGLYGILFK